MKKYEQDSDFVENYDADDMNEESERKMRGNGVVDHYDEDLSRRAVGRLFDPKESGRDTANDEKESSQAGENDDFVVGFDKPAIKDNLADYEERLDMYRRKERAERLERTDRSPAPVQPRPAVVTGGRQIKSKIPVRKASEIEDDIDSKDEYQDKDYEQFRERYKDREYIPTAGRGAPDKPSAGSPRTARRPASAPSYVEVDDADDYYDGDSSSSAKIVVGVICFILLSVMAILAFKLNSVSSELKEAQARLLTVSDTEFESLRIENDDLLRAKKALEEDNEALRNQLELYADTPVDNVDTNTSEASQPPSDTTQPPTEDVTYKVVSGDSLSKISKKFYGTEAHVDKIKQANNLTSDSIQVDMVLKIPKVD